MNEDTEDTQEQALIPMGNFKIAIHKPSESQAVEQKVHEAQVKAREMFADSVDTLVPALIKGWQEAMKLGDSKALRDVAEAMNILQPKGGINIMNQVNNNNSVKGGSSGPSIESIIKSLSKEKFDKAAIVDAEFEDIK